VGWSVTYSGEAAAQLEEAKEKALANPNGAHAAYYESVVKIVKEVIANPDLSISPQNMLKSSLAGVLRVKVGKRYRVFYLASSTRGRAIVLLFGYRKNGDKNDAYRVFERLLHRGVFDAYFTELGVGKP